MSHQNVAFAALDRAFAEPGAVAFEVGGQNISYSRYKDLVISFARRMRAHGVDQRAAVGLAIRDGATATIASSAIGLLGAQWIGVSGDSPGVPSGLTHLFGTGERGRGPGRIELGQAWYDAPVAPREALAEFPGASSPEQTFMVAHSSGTTGRLKFMPITYAGMWRRFANPELQDGKPPTTCVLFPPTSYIGFKISLANLVLGGTNVAVAPWEHLAKQGVNRVMGSPAQLVGLYFSRTPPPSRRLRSCKVAGAPVTRQFMEVALRYFEEVHVLYGATETGAMTLLRVTDAASYPVTVGYPVPGCEVQIVDAEGRPLPDGSEGMVRIRTPWMVDRYLNEPALTAEYFRDGWFHPGDLGRMDPEGLRLIGRTADLLNIGGTKLNAAELDEVIQSLPVVHDGYCFAVADVHGTDTLCAIVTLKPGADPASLEALRQVVTDRLGKARVPRLVYIAPRGVPRNENGKPMRRLAQEAVASLEPMRLG